MRAAHARQHEYGQGGGAVKAGELVEAAFVNGASPSAAARKVFVLLLAKAAGDAWQKDWFSATKAELRGTHKGNERLDDTLAELQKTRLRALVKSSRGQPAEQFGVIVSDYKTETSEDGAALVEWKFGDTMREVMRRSDYYAELRRQVVLALESRYSVTLYELGCGRYRRRHPVWEGTIDDFRAVLGVPHTYRDWTDIRRRTLTAAKEELDFLAPFTMRWHEHRRGRAVVRIEIHFHPKDDAARADAEAELQRSRIGRKARRAGTVEEVKAISPALAADFDKLRHG
jgi:plasmid replication initiation protein